MITSRLCGHRIRVDALFRKLFAQRVIEKFIRNLGGNQNAAGELPPSAPSGTGARVTSPLTYDYESNLWTSYSSRRPVSHAFRAAGHREVHQDSRGESKRSGGPASFGALGNGGKG